MLCFYSVCGDTGVTTWKLGAAPAGPAPPYVEICPVREALLESPASLGFCLPYRAAVHGEWIALPSGGETKPLLLERSLVGGKQKP